jgi:hypothetical protein
MPKSHMLGQIVKLVTGVVALVASLIVVKAENIVPKFFHKMPTNVITIGALGKRLVTNGTGSSNVDALRLVDK